MFPFSLYFLLQSKESFLIKKSSVIMDVSSVRVSSLLNFRITWNRLALECCNFIFEIVISSVCSPPFAFLHRFYGIVHFLNACEAFPGIAMLRTSGFKSTYLSTKHVSFQSSAYLLKFWVGFIFYCETF